MWNAATGDGGEGTGLAEADAPLIGPDADEQVVGRLHLADGDPEGGRERDVEEEDLDVGDLELLGGGAGILEGFRGQAVGFRGGGPGPQAAHFQESFAGPAPRAS